MSRVIRLHAVGEADVLTIDDVVVPEPGPGEVRIRVKAIGLNRAEVMFRRGDYFADPVFPAQLGYEAAGIVDAIGPDVTHLTVGDPVAVVPSFSFEDYGLYGELVLAPARATVRHPAGLAWEDAAAIWMQYATAWGGLIDAAGLKSGDVMLAPATASSVGIAAMQVARMVGAVPIATTRDPAKVEALKAAGAEHVIVTGQQDLTAEVLRLTGGVGAQVVFDPVGGPLFPSLVRATAVGGTIVVYGELSPEVTPLPMLATLGRQLTIRGYALALAMHDDAKLEAAKRFVLEGVGSGALVPKIAKTFPFEAMADAHRYLESNQQIGKVIVTL